MQNGYIHAPPPPKTLTLGAVRDKILMPDMDWRTSWPVYETQVGNGFESWSCVSFSALNCLEAIYKRKYNEERNWSDRFTSKSSGTSKQGNTFYRVAESIKTNDGIVDEQLWPMAGTSWEEYMSPIPQNIILKGKESLNLYSFQTEFVPVFPDSLCEALQYGPVQVALWAWDRPVDGVYERTDKTANHAVNLVARDYGKYWYIADQYAQNGNYIKKLAWNYRIWAAMLYHITVIPMTNVKILKDKNSKSVGFWIPATSESAFESLSYALGKPVAMTGDGKVDWPNVLEGEFELK